MDPFLFIMIVLNVFSIYFTIRNEISHKIRMKLLDVIEEYSKYIFDNQEIVNKRSEYSGLYNWFEKELPSRTSMMFDLVRWDAASYFYDWKKK